MKHLRDDITLNPKWKEKQMDRLLGFEILTRTIQANYAPLGDCELFDKTGVHTKVAHNVITTIRNHFHANGRKV